MAERGVDNKLLDGVNASLPRREERNTAIVAVGEKNIVSEFVLFINELKIALLCFAEQLLTSKYIFFYVAVTDSC